MCLLFIKLFQLTKDVSILSIKYCNRIITNIDIYIWKGEDASLVGPYMFVYNEKKVTFGDKFIQ